MADLKYYDVIFKPLMTEKSMNLLEEKAYSFYVHPKATKTQIKEAVERLFNNVTVESVNTMNVHPKKRQRRGSKPGETARRKKAIVKLTPSSSPIEYFEGI
ncbi:MAG: 50S ribosomal protein L23 [Defluviitaleaceae bacterium]|nr:50S ribosomal protein L23 [Defluviitaleaceae bacterium]